MKIYGLDPGPQQSALVLYRGGDPPVEGWTMHNDALLRLLASLSPGPGDLMAVEAVSHYGMPVGREVFESVFWAGRFVEAWGGEYALIPRPDVKLHLCGSRRAKDANVRRAILDSDRWERCGGGVEPAAGTKANQGPLYGIKGHEWAALAVAMTAADIRAALAQGGER